MRKPLVFRIRASPGVPQPPKPSEASSSNLLHSEITLPFEDEGVDSYQRRTFFGIDVSFITLNYE